MINLKYKDFRSAVVEAAKKFKAIKKERVRIISHLDADGISAGSIIIKALNRENIKYAVSIVQQIDEALVSQLAKESNDVIIFTDIGAGQLSIIAEKLDKKNVFVLDHHPAEKAKVENIVHINPHLFGIDGTTEVSGAGVAYLFAEALNKKNEDMAHIAVIGAIGDIQENVGFKELNKEILEIAKKKGKIKVIKGLRVFGAQTKPLHKVLEHCTEHEIPGVTGSESMAIQFLQQIGINPKNGSEWKTLIDLDEDDLKKLATEIVLRRMNKKDPESIIGPVYILSEEQKGSPLRDAKEFATLLNACGRLTKASLGIGACLNDEKLKKKAIQQLIAYKKEIVKALEWYEADNSKNVFKGNGFIIINAEDNVPSTMIGTIASLISKSKNIKEGTLVLSMARQLEGHTKISLRIAGNTNKDLSEIISKLAKSVDGTAGGHYTAAGAIIKTETEKQFLEEAKRILTEYCMEETI